ncbi:hypothetical protein ANN_02318 [Periplaneta americana]|uniref:ER membrane protein complex subunit 10 n=1 Tax=Periplaneta americana TaxID=6978 RepID=A0ABQ8U045_PERAM|nr:hypothetical protein ANN_02318 [Periplaneta americana]
MAGLCKGGNEPPGSLKAALDLWMAGCMVFVFAALGEFAVVKVLDVRYQLQKSARLASLPRIMPMFQPDVVEYDGHLSIKLQHAFDQVQEPQFFDRGTISIQSIRTGAVTVQQSPLTIEDKKKLKAVAEKDGIYRLRAFVRGLDGKETSFLTFVRAWLKEGKLVINKISQLGPMDPLTNSRCGPPDILGCSLAESHLSDILTVSLDHTGSVIAVSMSTSPAICEGRHVTQEDLRQFNTTVFVKHMEQGPVPDTAAYIQKLEKEREARERGETKDNRSFLAKYWMYIVPVVIFVVLSGAANPDGGAGAGGGGAGR